MARQAFQVTINTNFFKEGEIVYRPCSHDYGLSRDDSIATGQAHVSMTRDPEGKGKMYTIPADFLRQV